MSSDVKRFRWEKKKFSTFPLGSLCRSSRCLPRLSHLLAFRVSCRLISSEHPLSRAFPSATAVWPQKQLTLAMYSRVALVLVLYHEDRIRHEPQVSIPRSLRCSLVFSWRVPSVPSMIGRVLPVCLYLRVVVRAHGRRLDHSYVDGLAGVWKEEVRLWFSLSWSTHTFCSWITVHLFFDIM
ncbi:hypothetical protein GL50803_0010125 [Giardia duodenalis]|uniref:Uncharacterized protein n=1 Tax=Giardia intestinalis (strain ATCC 50803 / WB clone C6) TaxID=184922 RepID=A8BAH6_GIAIC|nr:hypothetical protein GL50803_0010125 [Giardia intestinalis]KAE8303499.1 hypothetical protein GL50803_0010125 [Giardia intestinalis]|eukprot:XP_001708401.1 Hypothetical protein GL50803_10125 [Giardia lamblia ATCC 50803]